MSIYKTYKNLHSRGTINGKRYALYEFTTFYYPYNYLKGENGKEYTRYNAKLGEHILTRKRTWACTLWVDQYGNEWHKGGTMTGGKYIAYVNDEPLNTEPLEYYMVCQLISKDAGLEYDNKYKHYEYCYNKISSVQPENYDDSKGEWVEDYQSMFPMPWKVGDRVFYVKNHDSDTRNGARSQVHTMIIESMDFVGDEWIVYNYDWKTSHSFCYGDVSVNANRLHNDVDELLKIYTKPLYMWSHNGGCFIEECKSHAYYMRYIKEQTA